MSTQNLKILFNYLVLCFISKVLSFSNSVLDYTHFQGEQIEILAGPITSSNNPIPFNFYHLDICKPKKIEKEEDSLGEILTGKEMYKTSYEAFINKNEFCKTFCIEEFSNTKIKTLQWVLKKKYSTNWYVDKLPAGLFTYNIISNRSSIDNVGGIPIGFPVVNNGTTTYYIYNHFQFRILVHPTLEGKYEVVGFNILPFSIKQSENSQCAKSMDKITDDFHVEKQELVEGNIMFTYDVIFEKSNLTLVTRWDFYQSDNQKIHFAGVILSNAIIIILTIFVICIFYRAVYKDIQVYHNKVSDDNLIDESGWKQVCNDVFRPTYNPVFLSVLVGTGIQLFCMLFLTLFLATLGFLRPEQRTNILTLGPLLFVFMGIPAGYATTRILKILKGQYWLKTSLITAFFIPGTTFLAYNILNIILAIEKSSAAAKFFDIVTLAVLWLFCSTPLVLIGAFFGIKRKPVKIPCKINPVPTAIPAKPWYMQFKVTFWIAGTISFSTIFIEFAYIMASLWREQFFFMATFLWIAILILVIVSGEISIILVYVNLCKGDYNWWWKSFCFGGSSAAFIAIYSVYYFFSLNITRLSAIIVYFEIMFMISAMSFLVCGSISTILTFVFLKKIYSMIKID